MVASSSLTIHNSANSMTQAHHSTPGQPLCRRPGAAQLGGSAARRRGCRRWCVAQLGGALHNSAVRCTTRRCVAQLGGALHNLAVRCTTRRCVAQPAGCARFPTTRTSSLHPLGRCTACWLCAVSDDEDVVVTSVVALHNHVVVRGSRRRGRRRYTRCGVANTLFEH